MIKNVIRINPSEFKDQDLEIFHDAFNSIFFSNLLNLFFHLLKLNEFFKLSVEKSVSSCSLIQLLFWHSFYLQKL
jgi:hypothetical protein